MDIQAFDKTEVFNDQLEPLLKQIAEICQENSIPYAICVNYHTIEKETSFAEGACMSVQNGADGIFSRVVQSIHEVMKEHRGETKPSPLDLLNRLGVRGFALEVRRGDGLAELLDAIKAQAFADIERGEEENQKGEDDPDK